MGAITTVASSMKNLGVGTMGSWALNGYFGLSTYQESMQEGRGQVASIARGVGETAIAALMPGGFLGYMAFEAARNAPSLAYDAYMWQRDYRRQLGREQKQAAFQNVAFQDTQATYTMRQAAHQVAQRSRYNIQQALLGNEAKNMMK